MVEVVEVKNKKQMKQFVTFPFSLYKDNQYWVPPLLFDEYNTLDQKKNPAFEYCEGKYWIAYKDNKLVGRIAGILNHSYVEKWGRKDARFGWIDFVDDKEVSKALLDTAEGWARDNGFDALQGPLGFCDLDKQGMLVEGFDELGTIISIYNHPYYVEHMNEWGYKKDIDWLEFDISIPKEPNIKLSEMADKVKQKYNLHLAELKKPKDALKYVDRMFDLINVAYTDLHGVVPITQRQVEYYTKQYFTFVNPDFISFILDENEMMVGFAVVMPSLSKAVIKTGGKLFPFGFISILRAIKKNDYLDNYLVAVRPEYQRLGVPNIILDHLTKSAIRYGVTNAIGSPELENNRKVISMWRNYNYRVHRRRRCYIKDIR